MLTDFISFHFESACNEGDLVWYLAWEDPLEKGMETHSSIPAWRIPWTEEPSRLWSMRSQRVRHSWRTDTDAPTLRDTYKLRKNQTPVARLGLTAEHGSLSWKSVQNQLYPRKLFLPLSLYLCGFLYCMWLNFNKLNTDIRRFHCKHTGFCIRRLLHSISRLSMGDFCLFALSYFTLGRPCSTENCIPLLFSSVSSVPLSPFLAQLLQFEICAIAASKLKTEQIKAVNFVPEVTWACPGHLQTSWETLAILKVLLEDHDLSYCLVRRAEFLGKRMYFHSVT